MSDIQILGAISGVMNDILDSVASIYEQNGVILPERRYITANQPAADCEQLTVSFTQLYAGPPGAEADSPQKCDAPRTVVLSVQLVRCIPTVMQRGQAPTTASLSASAVQLTDDAYLMMEGAMASLPALWLGALADATIGEPQGGFQAVTINISVGVP